jgi:hypothetical protein
MWAFRLLVGQPNPVGNMTEGNNAMRPRGDRAGSRQGRIAAKPDAIDSMQPTCQRNGF